MKTVAKFAVLLLIGTLALGMFVQTGFAQSSEQARNNKPAAADSVPTPVAGSDYVIGADDTLQISVWKEPDLTESLPVRPDGKISLPLLPNMTILQALSAAGFTQFANLKNVYLLRSENGRQVKLPFNYKDVVKGNHPEQNIALKPGDTVVVP